MVGVPKLIASTTFPLGRRRLLRYSCVDIIIEGYDTVPILSPLEEGEGSFNHINFQRLHVHVIHVSIFYFYFWVPNLNFWVSINIVENRHGCVLMGHLYFPKRSCNLDYFYF